MLFILQKLHLLACFVTTFLALFLKSGETIKVRLDEDFLVLHPQIFHMLFLGFLLTG